MAFVTSTTIRGITGLSSTSVYTDANLDSLITFADKKVAIDYPSGTSANIQEIKSTFYVMYLMATSYKGLRKALEVGGVNVKGMTDKELAVHYLEQYNTASAMAVPRMINDPRMASEKVLNPSPEPDSD